MVEEISSKVGDAMRSEDDWPNLLRRHIDERDSRHAYAIHAPKSLVPVLNNLRRRKPTVGRMLDLGCGYGGLTLALAEFLGAQETWGVEIVDHRIEGARKRNLNVAKLDLESDPLPFEDESVDLVTSFGLLDHLVYWDNLLAETHRVLSRDGYFLLSATNLRNYVSLISLLLGYQPRDIEVSKKHLVGILPVRHKDTEPGGHLHTLTPKALIELLERNSFEVIQVKPLRNTIDDNLLIDLLDRFVCLNVALCRRIMVLATKIDLAST